MVTIFSFPRSGNHFVRYLVEFLTGRATLGASGFKRAPGQDTPICLRQGPQHLKHVSLDKPVATKAHFTSHLGKTDKLVFILRNPLEAVLSYRYDGFSDINSKNPIPPGLIKKLESDSSKFIANLEFYDQFEGPKEIVLYEDLIGGGHEEILKSLSNIFDFEESRMTELLSNFDKYRIDSMKSPIRKPISVKKSGHSRFYSEKVRQTNPDNFDVYVGIIEELLNHKMIKEYYD